MTNRELKLCLKNLIFSESLDEQETPQDGFNIGTLSNEGIFDGIVSLIDYYKTKDLVKNNNKDPKQIDMFDD